MHFYWHTLYKVRLEVYWGPRSADPPKMENMTFWAFLANVFRGPVFGSSEGVESSVCRGVFIWKSSEV